MYFTDLKEVSLKHHCSLYWISASLYYHTHVLLNKLIEDPFSSLFLHSVNIVWIPTESQMLNTGSNTQMSKTHTSLCKAHRQEQGGWEWQMHRVVIRVPCEKVNIQYSEISEEGEPAPHQWSLRSSQGRWCLNWVLRKENIVSTGLKSWEKVKKKEEIGLKTSMQNTSHTTLFMLQATGRQ